MKFQLALLISLALAATSSAQITTDEPELPQTTEAPPPTTENPGLPYGAICNSLIAQCNRYSNTVQCIQRRTPPTTPAPPTTPDSGEVSTDSFLSGEDSLKALFRMAPTPQQDTCETGIGATLGRCQCSRNCKEGLYVDDGEFDEPRQICVGLVGSRCTLLVPNCVHNGHCNFLASTCVCDTGFQDDGNRRCVPRD